ncbi:HYR domain-containing protein [Cesiribacter andamanensis]|nr:HYR domain-containing protein [Cesiribacter andamanensis]
MTNAPAAPAESTIAGLYTDNCSSVTATLLTSSVTGTNASWTATYTYSISDAAGNAAANAVITYTGGDTEAPLAPASITTVTGECSATVSSAPTAQDNCAGAITGTTEDPLTYNVQGTHIITWTFNDGNGNSSTAEQKVIITDTQAPTITAPAAVSVPANAGCQATGVVLGTPVTADNCSVASVTNDAPTVFPLGTTTVTWTATDHLGLKATTTQTVTVVDDTTPVLSSVPADMTVSCENVPAVASVTATDNCTNPIAVNLKEESTQSSNPTQAGYYNYSITRTWTATDAANNSVSASQVITVQDGTKPTITAPAAVSVLANSTCEASGVALGTPTVSDNCAAAAYITVSNNAPTTFPLGNTTVIWTATDAAGNTASATQLVTVTDTQKPVIATASALTANTDPNQCSASISISAPSATDNCSVGSPIGTRSDGKALTDPYPTGTTTIIWNVTDANGNTAEPRSQTVTVSDAQNPSISTTADFSVNTASNSCTASVAVPAAHFDDNCTGSSLSWTLSGATSGSGSGQLGTGTFNLGTTTITYTVTDAANNMATATQQISVLDKTAPVLTPAANQNVNISATSCSVTIPDVRGIATDNCSGAAQITLTQNPAVGAVLAVSHNQTIAVTVTATDAAGNTSSKTVTLTAKDVTPPVKPSLADVTGQCSVTVSAPTTSDNCGGTITGTTTTTPLTFTQQGTYTITWTFNDGSGNSSTADQKVIIKDTQAPVITAAADVAKGTDAGVCTASINIPTLTYTDNCSGSALSWTLTGTTTGNGSGQVGTRTFNLGVSTLTYTVTDAGGNKATEQITVTVTDDKNPTITAPPAITSAKTSADGTGNCSTKVALGTPTTADNCSVASVKAYVGGNEINPTTYAFPVGTTTVTWTATDAAGNTASATQAVTVADDEKPVIAAVSAITANTDAGQCSAALSIPTPAATDNCSSVTPIGSRSDGLALSAAYPAGTTTITWNAADAAGNTATSVTQTITITDKEKPALSPAANQEVNLNATCLVTIPDVRGTATDNCAGTTITQSPAAGTVVAASHNGTIAVTVTATDAAGNTDVKTVLLTAKDKLAPAIANLPANITLVADASCVAKASWTAPTATDNCSGSTIAQTAGPSSGSSFPIGTTSITYTATDAAGITTSASFTVTVTYSLGAPVFTSPLAERCQGTGTTSFSASATNATGYSWSIAPSTAGTIANGTVSWNKDFSGDATITVTALGCNNTSKSASHTIKVHPLPTVSISGVADGQTLYSGDPDYLLTGSPVPGTAPTKGVFEILYANNTKLTVNGDKLSLANMCGQPLGTHTITYTYTNEKGCTSTATKKITIKESTYYVVVESLPKPFCRGDNVRHTAKVYRDPQTIIYPWLVNASGQAVRADGVTLLQPGEIPVSNPAYPFPADAPQWMIEYSYRFFNPHVVVGSGQEMNPEKFEYQWLKNNKQRVGSDGVFFENAGLSSMDYYTVEVSGPLLCGKTIKSGESSRTYTGQIAEYNIALVANPNPICKGDEVTFKASLDQNFTHWDDADFKLKLAWNVNRGGTTYSLGTTDYGANGVGALTFTSAGPAGGFVDGDVVSIGFTSAIDEVFQDGTKCSGGATSQTVTIRVNDFAATAGSSQTICEGESATFGVTFSTKTGPNPITYAWEVKNTATNAVTNYTTSSITISPQAGTYDVKVRVSNGCTALTKTLSAGTLVVKPLPVLSAIQARTHCHGDAGAAIPFASTLTGTTYSWQSSHNIGFGTSGTGTIPTYTASNTTTAPINATITVTPTANGCKGAARTFTITVNPVPPVNPASLQLCESSAGSGTASFDLSTASSTLMGSASGVSVTGWYTSANGTSPISSPYTSGNATVYAKLTNGVTGCSVYAPVALKVNPLPEVALKAISVCILDAPFTLDGGSSNSTGGSWSYSGTGISNNQFDPAAAGPGTHTYSYTYTNALGCANTVSNTIEVRAATEPDAELEVWWRNESAQWEYIVKDYDPAIEGLRYAWYPWDDYAGEWSKNTIAITETNSFTVAAYINLKVVVIPPAGTCIKELILEGIDPKPLPVVMLYFTAEQLGGDAVLEWATAKEENNTGFEIQVSEDGSQYRKLAFVPTQGGNSTSRQLYRYTDREPGKTGNRYYRLMQTDSDGSIDYYGPELVRFSSRESIALYPNPFQHQLKISVQTEKGGILTLQIADAAGMKVLERSFDIPRGGKLEEIALDPSLPRGVYLVITELDGERQHFKLVRQ